MISHEKTALKHDIYRVETGISGPNILVFGAIHGNEPCGPQAINTFIHDIKKQTICLQTGSVTLVPICNPKAFEQKTRQFQENLNRVFLPNTIPTSYEQQLSQTLIPLIDQCDALLDIHSYRQKTAPYIMLDYTTPAGESWATALEPKHLIKDWGAMYPDGGDTNAYAHRKGKLALTIECGQHNDQTAPDVAKNALLDTLSYFKMINDHPLRPTPQQTYYVEKLYHRPSDYAIFSQDWQNFMGYNKGDILFYHADQTPEISPQDGFMLMPKPHNKAGEEWFYTMRLA